MVPSDLDAGEALSRASRLAAHLLDVPTALVTLVEEAGPTVVAVSDEAEPLLGGPAGEYCAQVIERGETVVLQRPVAYLGLPLRSPDGATLGALCAIGPEWRTWTEADHLALADLGAMVIDELLLRAAYVEIERLARALRDEARTDSLTGLANRHAWHDVAPRELSRARRDGTPLSLVVFDLDGFKEVNDADGHAAGDEILSRLGEAWRREIREPDLLVRWGGDEFALLMGVTSEAQAVSVAWRLAEAVEAFVGISFGAATWNGGETLQELWDRADALLLAAKRAR